MPVKKYKNKYQAKKVHQKQIASSMMKNTKAITLRFHKVYDKDIIEYLDNQSNKTDYIRQLILADISKKD